jgi:hypothetical protein
MLRRTIESPNARRPLRSAQTARGMADRHCALQLRDLACGSRPSSTSDGCFGMLSTSEGSAIPFTSRRRDHGWRIDDPVVCERRLSVVSLVFTEMNVGRCDAETFGNRVQFVGGAGQSQEGVNRLRNLMWTLRSSPWRRLRLSRSLKLPRPLKPHPVMARYPFSLVSLSWHAPRPRAAPASCGGSWRP